MVKHTKYPFFGSQFHPEKIQFEHKKTLNKIQNFETIEIAHKFSMVFYKEVLKNQNFIDDETEMEALLIYNYPQLKSSGSFEQIYVFPKVFTFGNKKLI